MKNLLFASRLVPFLGGKSSLSCVVAARTKQNVAKIVNTNDVEFVILIDVSATTITDLATATATLFFTPIFYKSLFEVYFD